MHNQGLSSDSANKKPITVDYKNLDRSKLPFIHKVDYAVEILKDVGFDIDDIKLTYLLGQPTLILSIDWYSNTRSLCLEVFIDIFEEDVHSVIKTYIIHTKDSGVVDSSAYSKASTYGPYKDTASLVSDYSLYEDLRRLSHQINYNKNVDTNSFQ